MVLLKLPKTAILMESFHVTLILKSIKYMKCVLKKPLNGFISVDIAVSLWRQFFFFLFHNHFRNQVKAHWLS